MICSNCGKDIPFTGEVCPYCQRDKSSDQEQWAIAMVGAALGGAIGYMVNGIIGVVVGFVIGTGIGVVIGRLVALRNGSSSKPPEVRIASLENDWTARPAARAEGARPSAESRLLALDALRAKGLLTDEEYQRKRDAIIREI